MAESIICPVCCGAGCVAVSDPPTPRSPNAAPSTGAPRSAPARVTHLGRLGSAALLPATPAAEESRIPATPSDRAGSGAPESEGVGGGLIALITGLVLGAAIGGIAALAAAPYVYGWLA